MYTVRGYTPHLGTTVECCHSEVVNMTQVCSVVRAGDCHAAHCTAQIIRSDAVSETINHLAAGSFHPSHKEPWLNKIANIDVRGWGRS